MGEVASVEVHGGRELAAGTRMLAARIERAAPHDYLPAAEDVRRRVAGRVPRRTGRMAGSLSSSSVDAGVAVGYSGSAVYAGWVDFGGGRYRARPYVGSGRYLYPVALEPGATLTNAAERGAETQIKVMTWPRPLTA